MSDVAVAINGAANTWSLHSMSMRLGLFGKTAQPQAPSELLRNYSRKHRDLVSNLRGAVSTVAEVSPDTTGRSFEQRLADANRNSVFAFDFDGTIADTEKIHLVAYNVLLSGFGVELSPVEFDRYRGKTEFEIYAEIERDFGITLPREDSRTTRLQIFRDLAEKIELGPFEFVRTTLERAHANGAPCVVVSSQVSSVVSHYLGQWSFSKLFASLLTPDLFGESKTELFSTVPDRFGRGVDDVIVFEDSQRVLEALQPLGIVGHHVRS
jgi:beta-phosphoglucomutase-like phosphatase (HAD superfamily)